MEKVVIHQAGGYEELKIETFQLPSPKPGEVVIQVAATGVNFADCCVRMGVYSSAKKFVGWPITPGFEVSGTLKEVGEGVTRFAVGDKVIALTLFGGYTTHLIAKEQNVIPMPKGLTFEEAAAIPVIFLTAYYALFLLAHPQKNETMLVHSAAGGVGSSLVQMGKIAGCHVIGVVGSSHKVDLVKKLGADLVIDKSSQSLWEVIKKEFPEGVDIVMDANGIETLQESYRHLASGGRLVVYGFHTMFSKGRGTPNWLKMVWDYLRTPRFNPLSMTNENKSVLAFNLSYLFNKQSLFDQVLHQIVQWIDEGKLKPPPITSFPLNEVAKAQQALESGQTVGKIILNFP